MLPLYFAQKWKFETRKVSGEKVGVEMETGKRLRWKVVEIFSKWKKFNKNCWNIFKTEKIQQKVLKKIQNEKISTTIHGENEKRNPKWKPAKFAWLSWREATSDNSG